MSQNWASFYFNIWSHCNRNISTDCFEYAYYSGKDLANMTVDSAETCSHFCKEDIDCAGFVYDTSESAKPNCFNKIELDQKSLNVRFISGTKECGTTGTSWSARSITCLPSIKPSLGMQRWWHYEFINCLDVLAFLWFYCKFNPVPSRYFMKLLAQHRSLACFVQLTTYRIETTFFL